MVTQANVPPVEFIRSGAELLGIIVYHEFRKTGIHFFTPGELSQQLASMRHPAGHVIEPHVHNPVRRTVQYTQEVLVIKRGRLRVDFYDCSRSYIESRVLCAGDVILLAGGGHGFKVLEEVEMIEVTQGPYVGDADRTRFDPIPDREVRITALTFVGAAEAGA